MLRPPPRSTLFPYTRSSDLKSSGCTDSRNGRWSKTEHNRLWNRSEEHTSELQSPDHLVCRLLLEKKKKKEKQRSKHKEKQQYTRRDSRSQDNVTVQPEYK